MYKIFHIYGKLKYDHENSGSKIKKCYNLKSKEITLHGPKFPEILSCF